MQELSAWLLHDDQKERFEIVFVVLLNLVFLALLALLLLPLNRVWLAFHLAKGYFVLWIVVSITFVFINRIQHFFRVNIYDRSNAYIVSNLLMSCFLQVGWAAFAALSVQDFKAGMPGWISLVLYLAGGVSCLVAFYVVSSFYQGYVYRFVSLPFALTSFLVFCIWPETARALFGWFFRLL
jgi:hypothetical protein